jgi:hypothetical protein
VTGQHWGYCDVGLHFGRKVEAAWTVRGLEQVAFHPADPVNGCWLRVNESGSTWRCCSEHLQHACHDLLGRYERVSVTEHP